MIAEQMERDYSSVPPIGLTAYSDFYSVPAPRVWGDYWFKVNLLREFEGLGYPVDNFAPKILLHLFGEPLQKTPAGMHTILWIHSHPDWITPEILGHYNKIYCISRPFIKKIEKMGFEAQFLMIPTNMLPVMKEKEYDIVFVGNTKKERMRKIVRDLGSPPYHVKVWGWGWKGLIPDEWYGGEYYENGMLNGLYASAKIVLNDHHEDMQREGFINPRILDVLASGGFVISDSVAGMDDLLGSSVATYHTPGELSKTIKRYVEDAAARNILTGKGQKIALGYHYRSACLEIIRHIESVSDKLSG
jgi:spore maturation protein CgeB